MSHREVIAPRSVTHERMGLPPRREALLLTLAVSGLATSGPLIAATAAPALAIAFWRNAIAVAALSPIALARFRPELRGLKRREWQVGLLAGLLLAAHFAAWVPSVKMTSVASATALVATQPIWAAILARVLGRRVMRDAWAGILIGVVGAAMITGVDFTVSARAVVGDGLALLGAVLAAAYVTAGGAVRKTVTTTAYTTIAYTMCAATLGLMCLASGQQLIGYEPRTWAMLLALTVAAQLLGHSLINRALASTSATVVSLAILFEVPGATILALIFLNQHPPAAAIPGLLLLLLGLALVVRSGVRGVPVE